MKATIKNLFVILVLVLGILPMTGCGVDDAKQTVNQAAETVNKTASDAKETVTWWTRSTDHQSWVNPSGTKIEINERRKEGDFEIKVTYNKDNLGSWGEEKYTESPTVVMYVDQINEELIDELREQ